MRSPYAILHRSLRSRGMGLALMVACTSQPGERLLWFVGIGA